MSSPSTSSNMSSAFDVDLKSIARTESLAGDMDLLNVNGSSSDSEGETQQQIGDLWDFMEMLTELLNRSPADLNKTSSVDEFKTLINNIKKDSPLRHQVDFLASQFAAIAAENAANAAKPALKISANHQMIDLEEGDKDSVGAFSHSLERNGANNQLLYIVTYLVDHNKSVSLYSPKDGPMREDFEALGVQVTVTDVADSSYMITSARQVQQHDFVLANTIMRSEIVSLAQKYDVPYLHVIHESWPRDQFDMYASKVFQMDHISPTVIRDAFANVKHNKGNMVFPARMQQDMYDGLVDANACRVIYNGIPLKGIDEFRKLSSRKEVRSSLGYDDSDFVVLHIGTICDRKNQHVTARAFAKLVNKHGRSNAKLLMVGARYIRDHEIKYLQDLKDILEDHSVSDLATILDIQKDVRKYFLAADVVLVPSKNEVLPLVLAEAMAFERPVIASKIDGIPEAISDGKEGYLVEANSVDRLCDAIDRLHQNDGLRQRMGLNGRKRVMKQFSYDSMCRSYLELMDGHLNAKLNQVIPSPAQSDITTAVCVCCNVGEEVTEKCTKTPVVGPQDTILVDMDSVIVDWDGAFLEQWLKKYPSDEQLVRSRAHYEIEKNFSPSQQADVQAIITQPGFYLGMKALPGAVQCLQALVQQGYDVKIVTAPHPACAASCAAEKFQWIQKNLGDDWISRIMITRDKTPVRGKVLIDDKPFITGSHTPAWKHVLFTQPYNKSINDGRLRLDKWADLEATLLK